MATLTLGGLESGLPEVSEAVATMVYVSPLTLGVGLQIYDQEVEVPSGVPRVDVTVVAGAVKPEPSQVNPSESLVIEIVTVETPIASVAIPLILKDDVVIVEPSLGSMNEASGSVLSMIYGPP